MVAEPTAKDMEEMKTKIAAMETKAEKHAKQVQELKDLIDDNQAKFNSKILEVNGRLKEFDEAKLEIIDVLGPKFVEIKSQADGIINDAKRKFTETDETIKAIESAASQKFNELETLIKQAEESFYEVNQKTEYLYTEANKKFKDVEEQLKGGHNKKTSFLPDKMMVPQKFADDVAQWRKWKEDVTKYFDEGKEGFKKVMEDVAKFEKEITREVLTKVAADHPQVTSDLEKWKHLYRALEKLTTGEANKVIATVRDENGFEAWRQLHLRFEPELEAHKNSVLVDLHDLKPATTIEETKAKMVELKVRITSAEDILGIDLHDIQKKTAVLQVIDPITRQHTANARGTFQDFYTAIMSFANTATGRSGGKEEGQAVAAVKEKEDYDNEDFGEINGLGKGGGDGCRICGDPNHGSRECPYNTKGKGKGYKGSTPKGKGKAYGKGTPIGPCYNCGEMGHYARDCQKTKGAGKGKGMETGGKKGYGKGFYGKGKG